MSAAPARHRCRTGTPYPVRASLIDLGGWTLVTATVFSLMSGIFHEYYTGTISGPVSQRFLRHHLCVTTAGERAMSS